MPWLRSCPKINAYFEEPQKVSFSWSPQFTHFPVREAIGSIDQSSHGSALGISRGQKAKSGNLLEFCSSTASKTKGWNWNHPIFCWFEVNYMYFLFLFGGQASGSRFVFFLKECKN